MNIFSFLKINSNVFAYLNIRGDVGRSWFYYLGSISRPGIGGMKWYDSSPQKYRNVRLTSMGEFQITVISISKSVMLG